MYMHVLISPQEENVHLVCLATSVNDSKPIKYSLMSKYTLIKQYAREYGIYDVDMYIGIINFVYS